MGRAGKPRGERVAAWMVVLIVHAVLGWMLLRLPTPVRKATASDSALDLVWIAAPRSPSPTQRRSARAESASRSPRISRVTPLQREPAPSTVPQANEPAAAQPLSADFIHRAVESAVREPPGTFNADPFANRATRLPGRAANTFRMRTPPTLAERVAMVGKLFGGGDDPCRSARDSINELSQAGDSRELQNALDYEKRFCR